MRWYIRVTTKINFFHGFKFFFSDISIFRSRWHPLSHRAWWYAQKQPRTIRTKKLVAGATTEFSISRFSVSGCAKLCYRLRYLVSEFVCYAPISVEGKSVNLSFDCFVGRIITHIGNTVCAKFSTQLIIYLSPRQTNTRTTTNRRQENFSQFFTVCILTTEETKHENSILPNRGISQFETTNPWFSMVLYRVYINNRFKYRRLKG